MLKNIIGALIILFISFSYSNAEEITYKEILDNPTDLELNLNYAKQQESSGNLKLTISTASIDSAASSLSALPKRPIFDVFPNLPMSTVSSTVMGKFLEKGVNCGI